MQNTAKQNYPASVASYDTRPENEMGYNAPEPTRAQRARQTDKQTNRKTQWSLLQQGHTAHNNT